MERPVYTRIAQIIIALLLALCLVPLAGCSSGTKESSEASSTTYSEGVQQEIGFAEEAAEYSGEPYVELNDNVPTFTDEDKARGQFEEYGDLDSLGRCTGCFALVSTETLPSEKRGRIGEVHPTGWHLVAYPDLINDRYLYNRCHLIGYQLTGQNANEKNLITGTRYLNVTGMLPFEDEVTEYVKNTGNTVLYRVTPVFEGDELVARGVTMEGYSVEDNGEGVCFNVYCYDVQPGISIDYATGDSWEDSSANQESEASKKKTTETKANTKDSDEAEADYVLNTGSKKFHLPTCEGVDEIKKNHKESYHGTRAVLLEEGYEPCGECRP